jgi:hypothetical protein
VVGNDGPMGLWRIWTISPGHLDHSRDCLLCRYCVAPAIGFLVMCWRSLTIDARPFSTRTPRPGIKALCRRMGKKVPIIGSPGWPRCTGCAQRPGGGMNQDLARWTGIGTELSSLQCSNHHSYFVALGRSCQRVA